MGDASLNKIPFKHFILERLISGLTYQDIQTQLRIWDFQIDIETIENIWQEMFSTVSASFAYYLKNGEPIPINTENLRMIEWLRTLGVFDLYRYNSVPPHKRTSTIMKNIETMLEIVSQEEYRTDLNKFLFNDESYEKVAVLMNTKYGIKKINGKVIDLYRHYFWDTSRITGSEAFIYYKRFRTDNILLVNGEVKNIDDTAIPLIPDNLFFTDNDYVKWKAGHKVKLKSINDILEDVSVDCFFKFKEAINTNQIIDKEESSGTNMEGMPYNNETTRRSNVQGASSKIAKNYLGMLIKAQAAIHHEIGNADKDFFDKIDQLTLTFDEPDEKIADVKDVFEDVRNDI